MTENNPYGSRPELLPGFMNDHHFGEGRRVVKLGLKESRELEAVSLNRFPPTATAALGWAAGSYDERRWWDDEEGWAEVAAELLSSFVMGEKHVAVFWGNLVMPTVTLPARTAVERARELLDAGPHFWIYPLGGSILIECLLDGQVTVATIPGT
ncbi:hypothetical protein AB0K09_09870 [Streptomyces sp. NPDC049577]|uniref:hypothetical protein n=1 Tax=Streptomyces sp. NPDC049577 TaxID=3155153 RepID=UPI003412A32C